MATELLVTMVIKRFKRLLTKKSEYCVWSLDENARKLSHKKITQTTVHMLLWCWPGFFGSLWGSAKPGMTSLLPTKTFSGMRCKTRAMCLCVWIVYNTWHSLTRVSWLLPGNEQKQHIHFSHCHKIGKYDHLVSAENSCWYFDTVTKYGRKLLQEICITN